MCVCVCVCVCLLCLLCLLCRVIHEEGGETTGDTAHLSQEDRDQGQCREWVCT